MGLFDLLKKNIQILIVVLFAYILYNYVDDKDTVTMIGLTIVTAFFLLHSKKMVEGQAVNRVDAKATVTTANGVIEDKVVITAPGSGYTANVKVKFTPAQGDTVTDTAEATATVDATGQITAVKVTKGGQGYNSPPTITFERAPVVTTFQEAKATATVDLPTTSVNLITVSDGGQGYKTGTTVVITPASGEAAPTKVATASVTLDGKGTITKVTITDGGGGYKKAPTITFQNGTGQVASAQVTQKTDKQIADEAKAKVEKIIKSEAYKLSKEQKEKILSDLKQVKASNDIEKPPVKPQEMIQKDTLIRVQKGAPRMGTYDGLCLSGISTKSNYTLLPNEKINAFMGVQFPPEEMKSEDDVLDGPAIDGDEDSPHKLSMFANNMTSLNCCGESPYVSSSGCICITPKQKEFIRNRGLYAPPKKMKLIEGQEGVEEEMVEEEMGEGDMGEEEMVEGDMVEGDMGEDVVESFEGKIFALPE